MNKAICTLPAVAAAALLGATTAHADVAYMAGLFGATVDYASIVAPPGQGCDPGAGCKLIPYNNFSIQSISVTRGAKAIENFVAAHPGPNTIWTYSDSTDAVVEYVNNHPEDTTTQFYLLGARSTPGNFNVTRTTPKLPDGAHPNVTYVVRQYDIVADVPAGSANSAKFNIKQSVHRQGYDNIDLTNPAITYTDPRTGSVTEYFLTYPLPVIIKGTKTPAQIAAEDQAKRPGIESQYYLPGKVQRPVVLPSPVYPVPAAAAAVTAAAATTPAETDATMSEAEVTPQSGATNPPRGLPKPFGKLWERQQSTQPTTAAAEEDTGTPSSAAKKVRAHLKDRIAHRRAQRAES